MAKRRSMTTEYCGVGYRRLAQREWCGWMPRSLPKRCTTFQAALVVWEGFTPGYRQYHLEGLPSPCVIGELRSRSSLHESRLGPTAAEAAHNPTTTETATYRIRAPVSHVAGIQPSARPARLTARKGYRHAQQYPLQSRRLFSKSLPQFLTAMPTYSIPNLLADHSRSSRRSPMDHRPRGVAVPSLLALSGGG